MRQLSPCVKPQVMVVMLRPLHSSPSPPSSLTHTETLTSLPTALAFERSRDEVNNQALVKEERMPRSGGPLDSDLLISQALSCCCVSLLAARGCSAAPSLLRVEITACRDERSEGLPRPAPTSHQYTHRSTQPRSYQPSVLRRHWQTQDVCLQTGPEQSSFSHQHKPESVRSLSMRNTSSLEGDKIIITMRVVTFCYFNGARN